MPTKKTHVTLGEFARLCKISRATVSYYISHGIIEFQEKEILVKRKMIPLKEVERMNQKINRSLQHTMKNL